MYKTIQELPEAVKNALPKEGQKDFLVIINSVLEKVDDEGRAFQLAWGIMKKIGWEKEKDNWIKTKKESGSELDEIIAAEITEKTKFEEPEKNEKTYALNDVEIFATGTWHNDTYTEKDLREIVDNFYELREKVKPPIILGHRNNLMNNSGMPAVGWISSLRIKAGKILADFASVPEKIYNLIKKQAFKRISSELYIGYEDKTEKKKYGKVLRAVALLGADIPEVNSLKDIYNLYDDGNVQYLTVVFQMDELKKEVIISKKGGEEEMEDKERIKKMEEDLAAEKNKVVALQKEIEDTKVKSEKFEEEKTKLELEKTKLELEKKELEKVTREEEIAKFIETEKGKGRVLPRFEAKLKMLMSAVDSQVIKFSEEGKEREITQRELIKEIVNSFPDLVSFEELSKKSDSQSDYVNVIKLKEGEELSDVELDQKAQKIVKEKKISYADALIEASSK